MRPDSEKVVIAFLHPSMVNAAFMNSMWNLLFYDFAGLRRVVDGGGRLSFQSGVNISGPRNEVVKKFLAYGEADWLWFVDTDMVFDPDTIERLLEHADPDKAPIVGGLCFALNNEGDIVPTLFDFQDNGTATPDIVRYDNWPANTMMQVAATGTACLLVHKSVFERIAAAELPERNGKLGFNEAYPWFQETQYDGRPVGEDFTFCWRAARLDIPVYVNTAVSIGHVKDRLLTADVYLLQRGFDQLAAEADEPTAILVPVMRRPKNAAPFMASLRKTSSASVYALADAGDDETITAWTEAGAAVIIRKYADDRGGTFAEKVNFGARQTDQPWLFIVGDDVRFRPNWLAEAQRVAKETGAQVIGTNDLGNPRVMSGEHGTHLLISREYVQKVGASWDGPGSVCHEGYRHWFVDDEIVTAAKQRGVWTSAVNSVVEHLHPLWGKSENDEVYELGQSHSHEDAETFKARLTANA